MTRLLAAACSLLLSLFACVALGGCGIQERAEKKKEAAKLEELRLRAEGGDAEAQNHLGSLYGFRQWDGDHHIDYTVAAKWWYRAAEGGHVQAQINFAELTEYGKPELTAEMIAKAHELGAGTSAEPLQRMLNQKPHAGFPAIPKEAAKFYRAAGTAGNSYAQYKYAQMCRDGRGTERDLVEALAWFIRASSSNDEAREQASLLRAALTPSEVATAEAEALKK